MLRVSVLRLPDAMEMNELTDVYALWVFPMTIAWALTVEWRASLRAEMLGPFALRLAMVL